MYIVRPEEEDTLTGRLTGRRGRGRPTTGGRPTRIRLFLASNRVREFDELRVLHRRLSIPRLLNERHRALQAPPPRAGARHRRP